MGGHTIARRSRRTGRTIGPVRRAVTLKGGRASIVWGYHTAAALRSWTASRHDRGWRVVAGIDRADPFQLRQHPLQFVAARKGKIGFFCWPVQRVTVGREQIVATLGALEY